MRGAVSGEPSRGPGHDPGRRKSQDQLDLSHSSGYSDASSGSRSSSRSGNNPLKMIQLCFTPSRQTTSPTRSGDSHSDHSLGTDSSSQRQGSTKGLYGLSDHSVRSQSGGISFSISDIRKATRNFSPDYKIGQGGFGTVYKGRLQDGTFVAIKRAKKTVYDKHLTIEFNSEISTLSQIEHLNLVKFIGFLEHEDEQIVVVEYVPNGTLREHLDGMRGDFLDLAARLDIAIDVSHAITYLHMYADNPIIHRDIKSSNILLTENLRAKVADFGFARLGATETGVTHVSTQVKGTAGYLDPEYLRTYQLTDKSDVYSFGVLLVELITGRRPIESKNRLKERITVKWAMKMFMDGKATQVLDPNLQQNPATNLALEKILELALQCLAPTKQGRPSMRRCAEVLWSIRKDYRELLSSDAPLQLSNSQRSNSVSKEI